MTNQITLEQLRALPESYLADLEMDGESTIELPPIRIGQLVFVMSCPAMPEQYDVHRVAPDATTEVVAYMRLRHGSLRAIWAVGDRPEDLRNDFLWIDVDGRIGEFRSHEQRCAYLQVVASVIESQIDVPTSSRALGR